MSDLVTRLRVWHKRGETITSDVALYLEAANRIEVLENWQRLHRGDVLSLNNEVEQCRLEIEQLEREFAELLRLFVVEMCDFDAMLAPAKSASAKPGESDRVTLTTAVSAEFATQVHCAAKQRRVTVSALIASALAAYLSIV